MSSPIDPAASPSPDFATLRAAVESLREQIAGQQAATLSSCEARTIQLQREMDAMTTAAIERERDFSRRESEWSSRILEATAAAQSARMHAEQVTDKLAAAENQVRVLSAQVVQFDGMVRTQAAKIAGMEGAAQRLAAAESERDLYRARVAELAHARSRKLLLKLGLVGRCGWEK